MKSLLAAATAFALSSALILTGCAATAEPTTAEVNNVPTVEAITPAPEVLVDTNGEPLKDANGNPYVSPELNPGEESYATAKGLVKFGTTYVWSGGARMSISAPQPFEPTEYASISPQSQNVYVTITITNGTDAVLNPSPYIKGSSGGVEISQIYDSGNPLGDIGITPAAAILPGGAVTWIAAFSIQDAATLLLQSAPSYDFAETIWTDQI